jgi:hypothetical protein
MADTNAGEDLDAEGTAEIEDRAPGMDVELDEESTMAPRDYAIAAGDDPAYPVTAADERMPESVASRAAREIPDVGEDPLVDTVEEWGQPLDEVGEPIDDPVGDTYVLGAYGNAVSPDVIREQAIDADDPLVAPTDDESVDDETGVSLVDPNAGEGVDGDGVGGEAWALTGGGEETVSDAEEVAVRVRGES